jgi:hypothetical protein
MVESNTCSDKSTRRLQSYTASWTTTLNAMYSASAVLKSTEVLFPTTPRNHGKSQSEATSKGALSIHCAPYPIRVSISLQSHVNIGIIS